MPWNSTGDEVVRGTQAHGLEWNLTINESDWLLRQPHGRGERSGGFAKHRRPEKMMNERDHPGQPPQRRKKWDLVQILDDGVIVIGAKILIEVPAHNERISVSGSHPMDVDSVQILALWRAFPGAAKKIDPMSACDNATENFP
jgi:hypothetical protein